MASREDPRFTALERVMEERDRLVHARFLAIKELVDERDRLYQQKFASGEVALSAALVAQEKSVASAFAASDKAITKAEDAQREYNARSNEFRGQLDDQAKSFMVRTEVTALLRQFDEKLETSKQELGRRIDELRTASLERAGAEKASLHVWGYFIGAMGLVFTIVSVIALILARMK